MGRNFYLDSNNKRKMLIKPGDRFVSMFPSDVKGEAIMTVTRVTNQSGNGEVYYKSNIPVRNRKTGHARVWWFREHATLLR